MGDLNIAIGLASAFIDKVLDVVFAHWELQKVGKNLLDIRLVDEVLASLVEETEAFLSFIVLTSLTPSIPDNILR